MGGAFQKGGSKIRRSHGGASRRIYALRLQLHALEGAEFRAEARPHWRPRQSGAQSGIRNSGFPTILRKTNGSFPKRPDFDTSNPQFADLYNWNGGEDKHWQDWYNRVTDVVNKYNPDLMYFDVGAGYNRAMQKFLTYYYNKADQTKSGPMSQGVVVNSKQNFRDNTIVFDLERAQLPNIRALAWQTDTKVSLDENWCYIENDRLKKVVGHPGRVCGYRQQEWQPAVEHRSDPARRNPG